MKSNDIESAKTINLDNERKKYAVSFTFIQLILETFNLITLCLGHLEIMVNIMYNHFLQHPSKKEIDKTLKVNVNEKNETTLRNVYRSLRYRLTIESMRIFFGYDKFFTIFNSLSLIITTKIINDLVFLNLGKFLWVNVHNKVNFMNIILIHIGLTLIIFTTILCIASSFFLVCLKFNMFKVSVPSNNYFEELIHKYDLNKKTIIQIMKNQHLTWFGYLFLSSVSILILTSIIHVWLYYIFTGFSKILYVITWYLQLNIYQLFADVHKIYVIDCSALIKEKRQENV